MCVPIGHLLRCMTHSLLFVCTGSGGVCDAAVLQSMQAKLPGVIRESVRKPDKHHLTGKPTELMRQLVRICETDGRVLDPFAGSGTTLVAAQSIGRFRSSWNRDDRPICRCHSGAAWRSMRNERADGCPLFSPNLSSQAVRQLRLLD